MGDAGIERQFVLKDKCGSIGWYYRDTRLPDPLAEVGNFGSKTFAGSSQGFLF
jgi:hypothetical protein